MVTLVLLPGMDGTGTLFEPFVAALGSAFTVKAVRYPATEPLGYTELEAVVRAALPAEEPFVILGESFSGPIAVSLAASCSSQLKAVILCCTFVRNPLPLPAALRHFVHLLPLGMAPMGLLNRLLLGAFSTPALRSSLARAIAQVAPSALRARLRAVLSVDVSAQLSGLGVPVLYLRASGDRVVPRAASELIARLRPRTEVVQLEGPHCLLQAVPSQAGQVVGAFIRKVQNAA
jgi:pimeloyl-ACP methyl ester carboxylesterase